MSLLSTLKGLVVEEEGGEGGGDKGKGKTPPPVQVAAGLPAAHVAPVVATIDPKIRETIEASFMKQGPLMLFLNGNKALEGVVPDSNMRTKATLASLKVGGTPPSAVAADIDRALGVVAAKKKEALEVADEEIKAAAREQDLAKIAADISSKNELMTKLQQEIAALQTEQLRVSQDAVNEKARIIGIKTAFEATADAVIRDLEAQKAIVQQHTKE